MINKALFEVKLKVEATSEAKEVEHLKNLITSIFKKYKYNSIVSQVEVTEFEVREISLK